MSIRQKKKETVKSVEAESGHIFGISHNGLIRMTNEDRFIIHELVDNSVLVAVADGLGITSTGAYAAEMIVSKLSTVSHIPVDDEISGLRRLTKELDTSIFKESQKNPYLDGMGSTLVIVLLRDHTAFWVHTGDSRLYILSAGKVSLLTEDQTLSRFLVNENQITFEQSRKHYSRFVMDQYIGCGYAEPETGQITLADRDLLILTTDGLHNSMTETVFHSILDTSNELSKKGLALINAALRDGGLDNITAVMMDIQLECKE